ncbi:MAG: histidine kinase [Chitinophagaceae bacterium]|nr:histidine kinase [Chitinophagaceae bacterium]
MIKPRHSRKYIIAGLHIAAWLLLFSLPFLLRQSADSNRPVDTRRPDPLNYNIHYFFSAAVWVGLFYVNAYVLAPLFLSRKNTWKYILSLLIAFAAALTFTGLSFQLLIKPTHFNIRIHILFNFFIFLFMVASSTAYRLIQDRIKTDRLAKERENENLKTELSLLRSQVSPHFMFNVLNNMVSLARKKSDLLEPSLIKLSSLMRYMLYETDEEKVPLEKEIEYLQSYIDLQQQRFGKNIKVNVSLTDVDNHYEIEPMLLIPFVENAFKHGTGFIEDPQIDIGMEAKNHILRFQVRNKYNNITEEVKDKTSGIGLTNVKRRLNLLYGNNHTLLINKNGSWFATSLQLNLH